MNLQKSPRVLLLLFCSIYYIKCGILYPEENFNTSTPSITDIPPSMRNLVNKLMEATEKINGAVNSDITFHPLDNKHGDYDFDLREIKADPYVTGLDLSWSSTQETCKLVLAGDNAKLHGKLRHGYVFFDLDHLLTKGHSVQDVKAKILASPDCQAEDPFANSFLVVYRNVTKLDLFQELDELTVSRMKRDVKKTNSGEGITNETSSIPTSSGCRLVPWTVDFVKLGWDKFILFPETFLANSCEGQCAPVEMDHDHREYSVFNLSSYEVLRYLHGEKTSERSCKPAKFGSQGILFFGQHETVVLKTVSNMRVLACECKYCS